MLRSSMALASSPSTVKRLAWKTSLDPLSIVLGVCSYKALVTLDIIGSCGNV